MKNILKISFAYMAAIIGAGFASGSEIIYYFVRFGRAGIFGLLLSAFLFGFFAYLVLLSCKAHNAYTFDSLVKAVIPKCLQKYMIAVIALFMVIVLGGMISAFSCVARDVFGISPSIAGLGFSVVTAIILMLPEKQIINSTGVIGAFIVIFVCIMCIYLINNRCVNVFSQGGGAVFSAASYTSYNTASVCPFLCSAAIMLKNERECRKTGVITGIMCLSALGLLWCIISVYYGKIPLGEMPMLTISARQGNAFFLFYALILVAAILTSAVSSGFGIMARIPVKSKVLRAFSAAMSGYLVSSAGFSNIVSKLYNLVGAAALVLPAFLIIECLKNVKIKRYKAINKDI